MSAPYSVAARDYLAAGWSPIPLPIGKKDPVPDGFTGAAGVYVDEGQLNLWLRARARANAGNLNYPPGNVALRLPKCVLGIDVDAYTGKDGGATLAAAEEEWGALPPTWVSTSRDDAISGIRLYTIPEGLAWPGKLPQGDGVELIRWDLRYVICAPSVHPNGAVYRWFREEEVVDPGDGDGNPDNAEIVTEMSPVSGEIPDVAGLPELPAEWVAGLTSGVRWKARVADEELDDDALAEWISTRPDPDTPCAGMRATIARYSLGMRRASDDGGVHDAALAGAWAALGDAKAGHAGIRAALVQLRNVFLKAVEGRRPDEGAARSEWRRLVLRGAQKVTADDNAEAEEDPCDSVGRLGNGGPAGRVKSADINWRLDDVGNADRLIRVMNGRARWVEVLGCWLLWNGKTWEPDTDRQVERWCVKAINEMDEELAYLEGEAKESLVKAFKAHKKSSSTAGKMRAMADVAKGRRGIILRGEELDADPRLLGCNNGVLELREEGLQFRGFHPEQYLTLSTGVDYKPSARAQMWEEFLDRFLPDEEVRTWLQRLVGYSLLGYNPARLLVALVGRTSTGKTTFAEAIRTALGRYAGPMVTSILRENSDDKPRPDLLAVLPKRLVVAEELSMSQHLHTDQIKRLTGGGMVSARGMKSNTYLNRRPAFTPWLVTNETPRIEGADEALKRRILVVPFDVQIPRREESHDYLTQLLGTSLEAILAWAVQGFELYLAAPDLSATPTGALRANLKFAAEMSDFNSFIGDACDVGEDYMYNPSMLYNAYKAWCAEAGIKERDIMSGTMFGRRMNAAGFEKEKRTVDGKQVWVRLGIRLVGRFEKLAEKG